MKKVNFAVMGVLSVFILFLCFVCSPSSADLMYFYQSDVALEGRQVSEEGSELIGFKLVGGGEIFVTLEAVKEVVKEEDYAFFVRSGDFWLRKGNRERALVEYSRALAISPDSAFVKRRLEQVEIIKLLDKCNDGLSIAKTLLEQKKFWGAIAEYERLLELPPPEEMMKSITLELADTHAKIAYLYYDHVYPEGAEREMKKAKSRVKPIHLCRLRPVVEEHGWAYARRVHYAGACEHTGCSVCPEGRMKTFFKPYEHRARTIEGLPARLLLSWENLPVHSDFGI